MYIVAIAWIYVTLMMAVAEATSTQGSLLGAIFTFLLYGVLPLSIVMYLLNTPDRRAARRRLPMETPTDDIDGTLNSPNPNSSGHAASDSVPPKREEA